jgi:hypothetical protein
MVTIRGRLASRIETSAISNKGERGMGTLLARLAVLLFLAPGLLLLTVAGVEAQDKWSFVFTPQVWFENVRSSGFGAAANAGGSNFSFGFAVVPTKYLKTDGQEPTSTLFPQWGGQFAAQYGRWTFGVAGQYLHYETTQDFFIQPQSIAQCGVGPPVTTCTFPGDTDRFNPLLVGQKLFTEKISTDRVDTDLTATYFFPDVVKDVLDVTTGLGFKWIRASGQRTLISNGAKVFTGAGNGVPNFNYILKSCGNVEIFARSINTGASPNLDPGNCQRNQASFLDQFYGATIPTTLNLHATRDGKWLIPVTVSPFIGSEVRVDQVLGAANSIAYGGTLDIGFRYVFDNGIALYAGWRGQAFNGNNLFFSQGPLVNLSVALGGK